MKHLMAILIISTIVFGAIIVITVVGGRAYYLYLMGET